MSSLKQVVYVDVDDTLVRWVGTKCIPMPGAIARVRTLHEQGATLYLWSTGGADYARSVASELEIAGCFAGFLPKPNLIIDDQSIVDWRDCKHEYPLSSS